MIKNSRKFTIICCRMTNSRDNIEHLLLMKIVWYSRKLQD